ncbi:MAG: PulJ/GspJ family protein [Candidatus Rifleibacteriota bacterium]
MRLLKRKNAYTLVEIIIASGVFSLFLGAALGIFFHTQRSISKTSWINNATRDEGIALRRLSELAKSSSYPATTLENVIKIAEDSDKFKARLPGGTGEIQTTPGQNKNILAFPICTEQTNAKAGSIKWVSLWLMPSDHQNYFDLLLHVSPEVSYNPGPPDYAAGMSNGGYSSSLETKEKFQLLKNIEKTSVTVLPGASDTVELAFILSFPDNRNFKKEIKLSAKLNVSFK